MISERRAKRLKKRKQRLTAVIIVVIIAIIGYILVNNQFIKGLYYKVFDPVSDNNPIISIEDEVEPDYLIFDDILIVSSKNQLIAYNTSGDKVYTEEFEEISAGVSHFNSLKFKKCDDYIAAYDKGGTDVVIFNKRNIITNVNTEFKIIFAKPFNNGDFIVIAEDNSAKNQVILYSKEGKQKFIWHSGVNNILDASYSYDTNKMVVVTSDLSTGKFNSKILFFDISQNMPFSEMTFDNTMLTNINYYNKNNMIVIGDNSLYYFDNNGEMLNSYSYNEKMLTSYKQMPNGVMVLLFGSNSGNGSVTEIIDNKGKVIGSHSSENDILSVDAYNNNIILCGLRNATLLSKKGMIVRNIEYNKDLNKAYFLKNKFILVANSEIRIVN